MVAEILTVENVAVGLSLLIFPAPLLLTLAHKFINFWRRIWRLSYVIFFVLWAALAFLFLQNLEFFLVPRLQLPSAFFAAGMLLFFVANWLVAQAAKDIGLKRLTFIPELNPKKREAKLITTGVYAIVRHPRYLGFILMMLSLAMISSLAKLFALTAIFAILFLFTIHFEEAELLQRFGKDFVAYRKSVPLLLPRLSNFFK